MLTRPLETRTVAWIHEDVGISADSIPQIEFHRLPDIQCDEVST